MDQSTSPKKSNILPQQRYIQNHVKRYILPVNKNTEAAIIDHLDRHSPYTRYIKDLILKDMEAQKKNAET